MDAVDAEAMGSLGVIAGAETAQLAGLLALADVLAGVLTAAQPHTLEYAPRTSLLDISVFCKHRHDRSLSSTRDSAHHTHAPEQ